MEKLRFLKSYFSPFKPIIPKLYVGKVAIGTPYFFPRRWVKNKDKKGYMKAIPKKIGFDFVGLGWKTKWTDKDIRYEWYPRWSFVFFKWQIVLAFVPKHHSNYYEAWVYYEYYTDKSKSKKDRLAQCIKEFPQTYTQYSNEGEKTIDYYPLIIKSKYLKL